MTNELTITWEMPDPPAQASKDHLWESSPMESSPLEKRLCWPVGTLQVLHKAFRHGLDRFTRWDLSQVSDESPYIQASCIFRRGVEHSASKAQTLSSSYLIRLVDEQPQFLDQVAIIDQNVAEAWSLKPHPGHLWIAIDELSKSLDTVATVIEFLRKHTATPLVAIVGGGVLCDTVAFACALAERPFNLIPTTLLSMVDACVGGKTGVNFEPYGKNQLGRFAFPEEVMVWADWLKTLDPRDYRSGIAECVKHGLLVKQASLLNSIPTGVYDPSLQDILIEIIEVKARVVSEDPSEIGRRASLNLGHTFAHGLESLSHKNRPKDYLRHGEAVGIGLGFMAVLSHQAGVLSQDSRDQVLQVLKDQKLLLSQKVLETYLGLGDLRSQESRTQIYGKLTQDKKNKDGAIHWILLEELGSVYQKDGQFTCSVSRSTFETAFDQFVALLP
ncbi:3-dehydroquinate synthase [Pseudobacteriovorax antillogorgiicola]|uniref:3-dehydroquinate synthase n=1 Tax=Pseudobacteriovorax antillogorgiicola TaxID=1513793 RepID=A0A1Y6B2Q1_9BACT|nr:3-dehydroquinate synthase family protein [Pseudobacteriovorax antillogorgiicola]TCS59425.1 3-dehydroquinate synthase [Pseudobacteriovorax antillogorgiicola]SME88388.1 3-dehydroquinate synthase [Pseudobacteriovorax antillogorgiicola]